MRRAPRLAAAAAIALFAPAALAQDSRPAGASEPAQAAEALARCRKLLEGVRDHVFSFDDPAFYCFRDFVRDDPDPSRYEVGDADVAVPWRFLMERPSDYRGRLVLLEGRLLKRHAPYELPNRGQGPWYQCELGHAETRAACTVILIEEPGGIPLRAPVRVKGYFIKVRGYETKAGIRAAGPLVVARRLEPAEGAAGGPIGPVEPAADRRYTWLFAATALLAVVWLLLRRGVGRAPAERLPPPRGTRRKPGAAAGSPGDYDWLLGTGAEARAGRREESGPKPPDERDTRADGADD